jgi:hypothetical protein
MESPTGADSGQRTADGGSLSQIRKRLDRLRGRVFTALLFDGGARLAGMLVCVVAISFVLDRFFKLEVAARVVLLLAALAALGWIAWRFLYRRVTNLPGEDPLAVAVESRFPDLKDRLITAVQLSRETDPEKYGMSPQLIEDAIQDALDPARSIRFDEVLARGRLTRNLLLGTLALLLIVAGAAADPESAGIWLRRNVLLMDVRWPQKTYLVVDENRFPDGVARIVRGEDLVVAARSVGELHPERVTIYFRDSEGERGKATMKADTASHIYRHEFKEVAFPITFHLEGGDEVTRDYRIELMEAPEVAALEVTVGFPDYAGREPFAHDLTTGDPEMLIGGYIALRGRSTKPLEKAELILGEGSDGALLADRGEDDRSFRVRFAPEKTVLVGVRLRDTDGLSNPSLAPRFLVRVLPDGAPRVRLQKAGIGNMVVQGAVFPYRVRIRDDVKAVDGRLEVRKSAGERVVTEPQVVPLPEEELGSHDIEIRSEIEIASLGADPGTFLAFTAFALDNAHPEPQEGKSDPVTVKVVTLDELFQDLLRRQQEQRSLFEELIQRERRLRDRFRDMRDSPPSAPAETRAGLESQAQEQREIARRVRAIERALSQIFDEMLYNRIYEATRINELRRKVVRAMQQLRKRTMGDHARDLDDHARRAREITLQGDDGATIDSSYGRVIKAMEAVAAQMVRVEGFTEIVERMRGILKHQTSVKKATEKKLEAVMKEIFGEPEERDE